MYLATPCDSRRYRPFRYSSVCEAENSLEAFTLSSATTTPVFRKLTACFIRAFRKYMMLGLVTRSLERHSVVATPFFPGSWIGGLGFGASCNFALSVVLTSTQSKLVHPRRTHPHTYYRYHLFPSS
ncbi:hypothetical protein BaRGS_00022645 [Batillaria attramentaria]|uniref:Uncharacterized protein n=1 Tax=Batillaria attramentaria TaxID=370345 RepID=A0ABD0KGE8_9CAEN